MSSAFRCDVCGRTFEGKSPGAEGNLGRIELEGLAIILGYVIRTPIGAGADICERCRDEAVYLGLAKTLEDYETRPAL